MITEQIENQPLMKMYSLENLGGGVGQEYKLLKTIDISDLPQGTDTIIIDTDEKGRSFECDDVVVLCKNIKGTTQGKLQVQTRVNNKVFGNSVLSNYLQTTARPRYYAFIRQTGNIQTAFIGGYAYSNQIYYLENIDYTNKIDSVRVMTDTAFESGIIEVHGRLRI